ncbi:MAG: sugar phosphate isomerase/epimerase family protein [Bacteroidota bacterium]
MGPSISRKEFLKGMAALPIAYGLRFPHFLSKVQSSHPWKLSLNAYSFNRPLRDGTIDLFDLLDFCAEQQFAAIDPTAYYFPGYPDIPSDSYLYEFKRKAFLLGLDISGTGIRNDFADPDKEKREAGIELIRQWIGVAAKMGAPHLRIFTGRNPHEGYSRDQVFEWMAEAIERCCADGKKLGVMISLQNHNEFLKTAEDVNRLFDMIDSDWFGLNQDIGSYRQHNPYEEIPQNISHTITWQIKEHVWINDEQVPTDFVKLFRIIKQANYQGYLPLETLGPGDPYEKVPLLLKNVKEALSQL